MKSPKKLNLVGRIVLSGLALFGGAKGLADSGYLKIINHFNSTNQMMEVDRDNINWSEATDGYEFPPDGKENAGFDQANIYSVIPDYNLWADFRNESSKTPYDLRFEFTGTLLSTQPNWLNFNFPYGLDWAYSNAPITFSSDRMPYGPVVDVRRAIAQNEGDLPLIEVIVGTTGEYGSGNLEIGTRFLGDFDNDNYVGIQDLPWLAYDWGQVGSGLIGDISGLQGIPDGEVNNLDFGAFYGNYGKSISDPNTW